MDESRIPSAQFTAFVGGVVEEAKEGFVRLSLVAGPQHLDRDGAVHGGVITTLLDSAIGIALGVLRGREVMRRRPHATIAMSTSFLAQAQAGDEIVVEGRVVRTTETLAFGEAEARRAADGEVLARSRLTFAISGERR